MNRHTPCTRPGLPWTSLLAGVLLLLLLGPVAGASGGFSPSRQLAENDLALHGTGDVYYAGFIHVYDAALYGPPELSSNALLTAEAPKCLEIVYQVDLERDKFVLAADRILERQHGELPELRERIERLHAAYRDVSEGDRYSLCYTPGVGTRLSLNDDPLVTVPGEDFARVYLGIWLGEKPISTRLREALLGSPVPLSGS